MNLLVPFFEEQLPISEITFSERKLTNLKRKGPGRYLLTGEYGGRRIAFAYTANSEHQKTLARLTIQRAFIREKKNP